MSYVISYDDMLILDLESQIEDRFYDERFDTFEDSKEALLDYWETLIQTAKNNVKTIKKLKKSDI